MKIYHSIWKYLGDTDAEGDVIEYSSIYNKESTATINTESDIRNCTYFNSTEENVSYHPPQLHAALTESTHKVDSAEDT